MKFDTDPLLHIKELTEKVSVTSDLCSALGVVVQTICQRYGWMYGEAWVMDPKIGILQHQANYYDTKQVVQEDHSSRGLILFRQVSEGVTFSAGAGIPGRVWATQQSEWHPDVSIVSRSTFLRHKEAALYGIKAAFGVPLLAGDKTLAVLVFFSDEIIPKKPPLAETIDAVALPIGMLLQQQQALKELKESEERFLAFMNNCPAMVFMKDQSGCFTYVNQPLEKAFEVEHDELIGETDSYFLPEEVARQVHKNDCLVLATGQRQELVEIVPTPDGTQRYWQVSKFPFADSDGRKSVGGVAFDITQQKQLEQQLRSEKQEQERINESLRTVTAAAEAANRAKSDFLAMMSHEIRTPMNAMLGMAELLGDTKLSSQQRDFVEVIQTSGQTLLTVINDILDYSKIESNKLELEIGCLDLYNCVEQVLALFSNQAQAKGLAITSMIDTANMPSLFKGDAVRLHQVLSNLISNSIKFTKEGEVTLQAKVSPAWAEIPCKEGANPFYTVQFLVKDTGIGIAKEKLAKLFQPFSQIDASMTRQYGGTGLGLAISKRLIKAMGSEIEVISDIGKGTTFQFSIDLEAHNKPGQAKAVKEQIDLEQKNLLIVDSNRTTREYLTLQAKSWNLNVTTAESAEAAISRLFRSDTFDLIAINDSLSDMKGPQLALQVRNFPNYQTVPLILLQSWQDSLLSMNGLTGRVQRLKKPVRRSHFYNALVQELRAEVSKSDNESKAEQLLDTTLSSKTPLRILLVDDISLNQKVALQMLAAYGYQADVAHNGKEAVEAVSEHSYDVVFMDVQMPEMDGLEATRVIRADQSIDQPWIVAMTAHAMQGDREECLSAGMNGYIQKPIRKRDLAEALAYEG